MLSSFLPNLAVKFQNNAYFYLKALSSQNVYFRFRQKLRILGADFPKLLRKKLLIIEV